MSRHGRRRGVQALGERSDVPGLYAASHIAVLPSYREGLPKSLIEAAACGRAVVTTDVPGCRDAIEPDKTACWCPCVTPARWLTPSPGWRPIRRCAARWALRDAPWPSVNSISSAWRATSIYTTP